MSEIIYNINPKQKGLPMSYSRRRQNHMLDPFVAMKHIQGTNRVSGSHYVSEKATHVGSKVTKNGKHDSYDRYLRKLKSPIIKSKGSKTGIVRGCKCGSEPEMTYQAEAIKYVDTDLNINQSVYAMKTPNTYYEKATIQSDNNDDGYTVQFIGDTTQYTRQRHELEPYFHCPCGTIKNGKIFISDPTQLSGCSLYDERKNEYFVQMGGYYERVCL